MRVRRPELVLAASMLISAPMIPGIMSGAIGATTALERFLIALLICWAGGALITGILNHYSSGRGRPADPLESDDQAAVNGSHDSEES